MAEQLIFSTGSVVFSGSLHSTASLEQLDITGFTGSFTGTLAGLAETASLVETASFLTGPILDLVMSGALDHTGSANFIGNFTTSAGALIAGSELTVKSDPDPRILIQHGGVGGTQLVLQAVGDAADSVKQGVVGTLNNQPMVILQNNTPRLEIGTDGNLSYTGSIFTSVMLRSNVNLLVGYTELLTDLADPQKSDGSTATPSTQILGTTNVDNSITIGGWSTDNFGPSLMFVKSKNGGIGTGSIITDGAVLGNLVWTADDGVDFATVPARIRALVDDAAPAANSIGGEIRFEVATGLKTHEVEETFKLTADLAAHFSGSVGITGSLNHLLANDGPQSSSFTMSFADSNFRKITPGSSIGIDFSGISVGQEAMLEIDNTDAHIVTLPGSSSLLLWEAGVQGSITTGSTVLKLTGLSTGTLAEAKNDIS